MESRRHLKTLPKLLAGLGLLLLLMGGIWYAHWHQSERLYSLVEQGQIASIKMNLVASLIETARTRTRLTHALIHSRDPFEKDEIGLQLDIQASRFAQYRNRLLELGLSAEELAILEAQKPAVQKTLTEQRRAVEMGLSEDPQVLEEANRILTEEVYVGQGEIVDHFMHLLKLQKTIIDKASLNVEQDYRRDRELQAALFVAVMLMAMGIAWWVIRQITHAELALFLEKERAQITLRSIGDAVIVTDQSGNVEYMNPVAERIIGVSSQDVHGKALGDVFHAFDQVNQRWIGDCVKKFLAEGTRGLPSNEIVLKNPDKGDTDIALTMAPILGLANKVLGTVTTFQDISVSRELARQVESQARHDALTGLLNRREFESKVSQALSLYSENTTHALLMIDLDRFKVVNDNCGHLAGDELLKQLSQNFKAGLRKSDLVARLGGDEFAVFLTNTSLPVAVDIANKILTRVQEYRFFWNDKAFRVGASIGVVDTTAEGADYNYLYHAADTACYLAKSEGRDRVRVVTLDDELLLTRRRESECVNRINLALEENRFLLYAQSIVPLSESVDGGSHCEVLIRLRDELGDIISPMAFIPVAERYNLMPRIDSWVIASVIAIIRAHPASRTIYSVNVSGQSLGDASLNEQIVDRIRASGINPALLCFEITETAAIGNMENAKRFMNALKTMGCSIALDDFGSGLSSFGYLKNLPIDYIKIDGVFVKQISEDPTSYVMVNAIHGVAQSLGLRTIAEYVGSEDTVQKLKEIGVDFGQGFHFDEPAPLTAEMIERMA